MEDNGTRIYTQSSDPTTAMAMMNNNPWMYLVMLALFNNGGFGGNGRNVEAQIASMQDQINSNNNNQYVREAINGNGFAISQLAQNLNVDANSLREAINTVTSVFPTSAPRRVWALRA